VAQELECLSSKPEFKPQYHLKKKKRLDKVKGIIISGLEDSIMKLTKHRIQKREERRRMGI
jgi:hypothetical protein